MPHLAQDGLHLARGIDACSRPWAHEASLVLTSGQPKDDDLVLVALRRVHAHDLADIVPAIVLCSLFELPSLISIDVTDSVTLAFAALRFQGLQYRVGGVDFLEIGVLPSGRVCWMPSATPTKLR